MGRYRQFRQIVGEIVEVSEAICEARPLLPLTARPGRDPRRKGGLFGQLQAEFAAEVAGLAALAARSLGAAGDLEGWSWPSGPR